MNNDTRSRKWQITINNPVEKGYTHDKIVEILNEFKGCVYYCLSDEIGEGGTFHTHIFVACANGLRFSSLKKAFDGGHFEMANGTSRQNRDYVFKEGKWTNDKKGDTNLRDSHLEWGELPIERQGKRNDLDDLYDMIYSGKTVSEILEIAPQHILNISNLERARSLYLRNKYKASKRELTVTYIQGCTGTGKTSSVMDCFGYENVYRVTDYSHPFDCYDCEDVVVFEEFRSSLPLGVMLNYLDIYPVMLPARYAQKVACFTKVFIISNYALEDQFFDLQKTHRRDFDAFLRRIHYVEIFMPAKQYRYTVSQYMSGFVPCICTPFSKKDEVYFR